MGGRLQGFLLGVLCVLALFVLTGFDREVIPGRYQIAAISNGEKTGIYIVDTASGVVKNVGCCEETFNQLGTPFEEMRSRR